MSAKADKPLDLFTDEVKASDFDAAFNYLTLLWDPKRADVAVNTLRGGKVVSKRVNDIVRAAGGVPWGWDDPGVKREIRKALAGRKLHPPFLVDRPEGLVIADGSHRVSFAYLLDPFMYIPVLLA